VSRAAVDRAFVFASGTMDRHLTYVAMTRGREAATLYVDRQEFMDRATLVEHWDATAPHPARVSGSDRSPGYLLLVSAEIQGALAQTFQH
jgi:hypothetical protein